MALRPTSGAARKPIGVRRPLTASRESMGTSHNRIRNPAGAKVVEPE